MKRLALAALFAAGSAAAQDQGTPVTFGGATIAGDVQPVNEQGVPQWVNPNPDATALKQWWKEQVSKTRQSQVPAGAAPRPAVPPAAATQAPLTAVQSGCRPELRALNLCHIQVPAGASAPALVTPAPRPVAAPVVVTPSPWPVAAPVVVTPSPGPVAAPLVVTPAPGPLAAPVAPPRVVVAPVPAPGLVPQPPVPAATVLPPTRLDPALSGPAVVTEVKPSGPPAWETPPQGRNPFEEAPSSVLFEVKR